MATLEQLESALIKADAAGNVDDARAFAAEIRNMRGAAPKADKGYIESAAQGVSKGIGDVMFNAQGLVGKGLEKLGAEQVGQFLQRDAEQRKQQEAQTLAPYKASNPMTAGGGELAGEIIGTLPVGGAFAKGVTKAASYAPQIASKVNPLAEALRTGGFSAGGMTGAGGLATRMVGGAATGGASAALIDPNDAGMGAAIGAVAPSVVKGLGMAGKAMGERAASQYADELAKFSRSAPQRETLKEAIDLGYVVPPNMVNPSAKNAIIESFSGKQATGQLASVRNQEVTEKLVRQSLGLAEDAPLTKSALEQIRKVEGGAYKQVSDLSPQAAADLEALKQARNDAQGWFNAYNRSASPEDLAKAKGFRDTADALESQLEVHAKQAGKDELVPQLRDARKQIAKTYTVERALNDASGTVNPKVIARLYEKGKPLSGGLETVGRFASAFPSVNQSAQQMGSPAAHNLRSMASLLSGAGGTAALGPAGVAAAALPFATGAASRGLMFRKGAQEALANQAAPKMSKSALMADLLRNQEMQMLLSRSAPVAISSGQ